MATITKLPAGFYTWKAMKERGGYQKLFARFGDSSGKYGNMTSPEACLFDCISTLSLLVGEPGDTERNYREAFPTDDTLFQVSGYGTVYSHYVQVGAVVTISKAEERAKSEQKAKCPTPEPLVHLARVAGVAELDRSIMEMLFDTDLSVEERCQIVKRLGVLMDHVRFANLKVLADMIGL